MGASSLGTEYKKLRYWARRNLVPVCWLCGQWIDRDLKFPDKRSWSADHIIPVSKRPDLALERDNIAPAHLSCNSSRQDKDPHAKTEAEVEIDW